jgi:hypothetical protein
VAGKINYTNDPYNPATYEIFGDNYYNPTKYIQLALIRSMTQWSMMDFCTINGKTVTSGSYGEPVET